MFLIHWSLLLVHWGYYIGLYCQVMKSLHSTGWKKGLPLDKQSNNTFLERVLNLLSILRDTFDHIIYIFLSLATNPRMKKKQQIDPNKYCVCSQSLMELSAKYQWFTPGGTSAVARGSVEINNSLALYSKHMSKEYNCHLCCFVYWNELLAPKILYSWMKTSVKKELYKCSIYYRNIVLYCIILQGVPVIKYLWTNIDARESRWNRMKTHHDLFFLLKCVENVQKVLTQTEISSPSFILKFTNKISSMMHFLFA